MNKYGLVTTFLPFRQLDERFDYYSPVIIANNKFLTKHPDVARKFLKAVKKAMSMPSKTGEGSRNIMQQRAGS